MKRAFGFFRRLCRNERGNVLLLAAAGMPLLIGASALAIDTIQLSLAKRQLQRTADSAAIAGAHALIQDKSEAAAEAAVTRDLLLNDSISIDAGFPDVQSAPDAGVGAGNDEAVRVILSSTRQVPFMSFFIGSTVVLTAEATAAMIDAGEFCLIALEDGNVTGITATGNAAVDLECGIATNARGAAAITGEGSADVKVTALSAAGGIPKSDRFSADPVYQPYSVKMEDPFGERTIDPAAEMAGLPNCSSPPPAPNSGAIPSGCYSEMEITGPAQLDGIYYIRGGNINLGPHADVTGTNVTLVLASDGTKVGTFDMDGHADISISATSDPTSPYKDIAIHQQDIGQPIADMVVNGASRLNLEGALYFPRTNIEMKGNAGVAAQCLQIVARRLHFSGSLDLDNVCTKAGGPRAFRSRFVRLIG